MPVIPPVRCGAGRSAYPLAPSRQSVSGHARRIPTGGVAGRLKDIRTRHLDLVELRPERAHQRQPGDADGLAGTLGHLHRDRNHEQQGRRIPARRDLQSDLANHRLPSSPGGRFRDVSQLQPAVHAGLRDPEVLNDLRQPRLALTATATTSRRDCPGLS